MGNFGLVLGVFWGRRGSTRPERRAAKVTRFDKGPRYNARNAPYARTRTRTRTDADALLTHTQYLLTYCYQLLKTNKQNSVSVCYVCC